MKFAQAIVKVKRRLILSFKSNHIPYKIIQLPFISAKTQSAYFIVNAALFIENIGTFLNAQYRLYPMNIIFFLFFFFRSSSVLALNAKNRKHCSKRIVKSEKI